MAKRIVRTLYFASYDGRQVVSIDHNDISGTMFHGMDYTTEQVMKREVVKRTNMDNKPAEGHPVNPYLIHSLQGYSFFYTETEQDELLPLERILYPSGWRKEK